MPEVLCYVQVDLVPTYTSQCLSLKRRVLLQNLIRTSCLQSREKREKEQGMDIPNLGSDMGRVRSILSDMGTGLVQTGAATPVAL